jgi:hypothetical protein
MTVGKTAMLTLGLVGSFALGVWTGPYVTDRTDRLAAPAGERAQALSAENATSAIPVRVASRRTPATTRALPAASPELHARLKPVLNPGTDLTLAAEGFRTAEQFAAVVHAARNTGTPFPVLKHRVLEDRMTLAAALRQEKPGINAVAEATRAQTMARGDVAAIAG